MRRVALGEPLTPDGLQDWTKEALREIERASHEDAEANTDDPGMVELATTTEVLTGTDTDRAVTPDALAALWEKGSNIASAATISLGEGGYFRVTGTTTITDIDFAIPKDGRWAVLVFDAALTLTHNATTLILPGAANIVTAAGDACCVVQDAGDNVKVVWYMRASGTALVPAPLASTTEVLTGTDAAKAVTPDALAALWEKGADVASAGTVSFGEGGFFHITGTTTITDIDFATPKDGRWAWVIFDGALTLTHNATTLILPGGANITTAANDRALFVQDNADNVYCAAYIRASGVPLVTVPVAQGGTGQTTEAEALGEMIEALTEDTAPDGNADFLVSYDASADSGKKVKLGIRVGSAVDTSTGASSYTVSGLPANIRRITILFDQVSLSGTDNLLIQLGDAEGVETTGYNSASTSSGGPVVSTSGFIMRDAEAARALSGTMTITRLTGNVWVASHALGSEAGTDSAIAGGGSKTLSAELDRVVLDTTGTDTFDGGQINVLWEF